MRSTRVPILLLTIGIFSLAWGQGRNQAGRGAPAQQSQTPANAAGRGGRGTAGAAAAGPGSGDFYNYDPAAASGQPIPDSQPVETHQKIKVNGQALAYTARAGYLPLHNATTGQSEAHIFYTYYAQDGSGEAPSRPVVFFLGGAPGVSASWQEFGGLGPKRMNPATESESDSPAWIENPSTLLTRADLVFVNPVGTGYSRPDQPSWGPNFWNTGADIASLGEFVRSFATHYNRTDSALFLAGD